MVLFPADVYRSLETSDMGLSDLEAQRRLKIYGYNQLERQKFGWGPVLLRQFKNPIFAILAACGVVTFFFEAPEQSISIFAMIVLAVVLGFFNEYRAEKTVEALRKKVSLKAVVVRDGKPSETDSTLTRTRRSCLPVRGRYRSSRHENSGS